MTRRVRLENAKDPTDDHQTPPASVVAFLVGTTLVAGVFAAVYHSRKTIRDAKRIKHGDTVGRVHQLLGAPTTAFETDADLRRSEFGPSSFVFNDTANTASEVPVTKLPVVTGRAEWTKYASAAVHLVYYDEDGVTVVFWGDT